MPATHVHSEANNFDQTKTVPLATWGAAGRFAVLIVTSRGWAQSTDVLNSHVGWTLFLDLGAGDGGNGNRPRMWGLHRTLTGSMSDFTIDHNDAAGGWVLAIFDGTPDFGSVVSASEFGFGTSMELAAPGTGDGVRVGVCSPNAATTVTTPATSIDPSVANNSNAWGSYEVNTGFTSGTTPSFTSSATDYTLGWVFVPVVATVNGTGTGAASAAGSATGSSGPTTVNGTGAGAASASGAATGNAGNPAPDPGATSGAGGNLIRVDVLDAGHARIGELTDFDEVAYVRSAVAGGRFVITCPPSRAARLLRDTPGAEIRVTEGGQHVFAGPVLEWEHVDDLGEQRFRFAGINWLAMLEWRWTDPEPGTATPPFATDAYDVYTGQVSTVLAQMVDDRCGTAALPARQFLTVLHPIPSGPTVTHKLRFRETLAELVERVATVHGYTVDVTLSTSNVLEFRVWAAPTRTEVAIGPEIAGVLGWASTARAPEATHMITGGQGELTARTFSSRTLAAGARWPWRIEDYTEHTEIDNLTDLNAAADDELAERAEQVTFTVDVQSLETDVIRFGRDFTVGDYVPLRHAGTVQTVRIMQAETVVRDTVERTLTVGVPRPRDIALAVARADRADRTARRQRGA